MPSPIVSKAAGFTLVELVATMIIIGILAATAMPRLLERSTFDARGFSDQLGSMLRYAQKHAIAQRRAVYVRLDGASVALCLDAACSASSRVAAPGGANSGKAATLAACDNNNAWFCEAVPDGIAYTSALSLFYFSALGKPYLAADVPPNSSFVSLAISVTGDGSTRVVTVERDTGYVH